MKKIILLSLLTLSFWIIAPHVLAQTPCADGTFCALAPISGLTDPTSVTSAISTNSLATFFNNLYKYLIGLAATLAVIEIIWGGLEISTKDSVSKQSDGKERITQAIFGLVLVLSPVLVFSIINPSIINLSLNLPPIDLKVPVVPGENGPLVVTDPSTGCLVTGGDYIKVLKCPTQDAVNNYTGCTGDLGLIVSACNTKDPVTGALVCTSYTGYCVGKTTTLTAYRYYQSYSGVLVGDSAWVPNDMSAATTFANGCVGNGGVVGITLTTAASAFLASHAYQTSVLTNGCSASYGTIPPADPSKYGGVVCYGQIMSCNVSG